MVDLGLGAIGSDTRARMTKVGPPRREHLDKLDHNTHCDSDKETTLKQALAGFDALELRFLVSNLFYAVTLGFVAVSDRVPARAFCGTMSRGFLCMSSS